MSDDKNAKTRQPSDDHNDHKEDIVEAEAHGQEPPQSSEGILSGRSNDYDHSDEETEMPAHAHTPEGHA